MGCSLHAGSVVATMLRATTPIRSEGVNRRWNKATPETLLLVGAGLRAPTV